MAKDKIEKPVQLTLGGGVLGWDYASAFNILTINYTVGGHQYSIHFEQNGLTYYEDGNRKWHIAP